MLGHTANHGGLGCHRTETSVEGSILEKMNHGKGIFELVPQFVTFGDGYFSLLALYNHLLRAERSSRGESLALSLQTYCEGMKVVCSFGGTGNRGRPIVASSEYQVVLITTNREVRGF